MHSNSACRSGSLKGSITPDLSSGILLDSIGHDCQLIAVSVHENSSCVAAVVLAADNVVHLTVCNSVSGACGSSDSVRSDPLVALDLEEQHLAVCCAPLAADQRSSDLLVLPCGPVLGQRVGSGFAIVPLGKSELAIKVVGVDSVSCGLGRNFLSHNDVINVQIAVCSAAGGHVEADCSLGCAFRNNQSLDSLLPITAQIDGKCGDPIIVQVQVADAIGIIPGTILVEPQCVASEALVVLSFLHCLEGDGHVSTGSHSEQIRLNFLALADDMQCIGAVNTLARCDIRRLTGSLVPVDEFFAGCFEIAIEEQVGIRSCIDLNGCIPDAYGQKAHDQSKAQQQCHSARQTLASFCLKEEIFHCTNLSFNISVAINAIWIRVSYHIF